MPNLSVMPITNERLECLFLNVVNALLDNERGRVRERRSDGSDVECHFSRVMPNIDFKDDYVYGIFETVFTVPGGHAFPISLV